MKKIKFILFITIFLFLPACLSKDDETVKDFNKKIKLSFKVVYLKDKRFPSLSMDEMEKSLLIAKDAIKNAYGAQNVSFSKIDTIDIDSFFNKVVKNNKTTMNVFNPFSPQFKRITQTQKSFFEQWGLKELKKFLPDSDRDSINSYDDYYKYIFSVWLGNTEKFKSLMINGKPVFTKDTLFFQTYSGWELMFQTQSEYDIFFTNTLVFYDDLDRPFPHSIFKHAKTGGMGEISPNAPNGSKRAMMISTIAFSDIPYFSENNISKENIPNTLGIFYLTHEFGHMMFKLGDVYDHPEYCIMSTPPENFSAAKAASKFESHKGPCPLCENAIEDAMQDRLKKLDTTKKK